jgi:hypothetical protein
MSIEGYLTGLREIFKKKPSQIVGLSTKAYQAYPNVSRSGAPGVGSEIIAWRQNGETLM